MAATRGAIIVLRLCAVLAECGPMEFRCNNGECIDVSRVCDFHADCVDTSDEWHSNCGKHHHSSSHALHHFIVIGKQAQQRVQTTTRRRS